jgi:ribosomal protein L11 methyltransferase
MLEGLPPNNASHVLRLVCDERRARAIVDVIVETFDPAETAACAFEEADGTSHSPSSATGVLKDALWAVEVFFGEPPDEAGVRALIEAAAGAEAASAAEFSQIAQRDWVASALTGLKPVRAGRVLVHGSHDRKRLRGNDVGIEIEAALAFGTGHHGTTLGCLLALDRVLKRRRPARVLDVGTGTGVLAIASAKLLHRPVACGDIDPIETAGANARANGVGALVRPVVATGLRHGALRKGRADLIFANILAKPLRLLAPSLARTAAPGAELVLSGLLARDVPGILAAYRAQGYALRERRDIDGWATLTLKRGGGPRPLNSVHATAARAPRSKAHVLYHIEDF